MSEHITTIDEHAFLAKILLAYDSWYVVHYQYLSCQGDFQKHGRRTQRDNTPVNLERCMRSSVTNPRPEGVSEQDCFCGKNGLSSWISAQTLEVDEAEGLIFNPELKKEAFGAA